MLPCRRQGHSRVTATIQSAVGAINLLWSSPAAGGGDQEEHHVEEPGQHHRHQEGGEDHCGGSGPGRGQARRLAARLGPGQARQHGRQTGSDHRQ